MDAKFALRSLGRTPGFTVLAVLILALGIGANTAVFSVVHGVILRPLNFRDPSHLVALTNAWKGARSPYASVSGPDFLDVERQSSAFESLAAYGAGPSSVVAGGKPEFTGLAGVSKDFFHCFGISPLAGRSFSAADFTSKPSVALVNANFWERHFGDAPFRPGKSLETSGVHLDIIGIVPAQFQFPENSGTEIWTTSFEPLEQSSRSSGNYRAIGRLKPGVTLREAQAQLDTISARLARQYPDSNKNKLLYVSTLTNYTVRDVKTSLYLLLGAVCLVLLIACANVANLLLARGLGRTRELAIRAALGASHRRMIRQLLVETLIIAAAGCSAGVLLANLCLPVLLSLAPRYVPRLDQVRLDPVTLFVCIGAGLASSLIFGLAPALSVSKVDPQRALRAAVSRGVLGGAASRLRQSFVTTQIALCLILLVSATMLLRSFAAMTNVDLGFRPEHFLIAALSVPSGNGAQANINFFQPLLSRLANAGQIESVALSSESPADEGGRTDVRYIITGQTMNDFTVAAPSANVSLVSPGFFRTLGIRQVSGRSFDARDAAGSPLVVVINQRLARASFPKTNPIGQKITCGLDEISLKGMTIVGVVSDARLDSPSQLPSPDIYLPWAQHARTDATLLVKAGPDPMSASRYLSTTIHSLNPDVSVKYTTLERNLASAVATPRFSTTLTSVFAGLAVLLAAIGIYGVMAYSVGQRTGEIGLRMAIGADRATVLRMILAETLKLGAAGLVIGLFGSWAAARLLQSQLFNVSTSDPIFYVLTLVVLIAVTLLAGFLPAARASRVEPLDALRQE